MLEELKNNFISLGRALVIAPKRVAEDTWTSEHMKWDHLKSLKIVRVMGSPKERQAALNEEGDVYIVTRDNVAWLVDTLGREWPFETVIIDELSSFKSPTSKRFKKLRTVRPLMQRVIGLTGTPAPNGYKDLWSQLYLLDRGERLGKTVTAFRSEYCDTLYRPTYKDYAIKKGAPPRIDQAISDICISMKAKDYLNLKEPLYLTRKAKLDDKEYGLYKKMEREALLEINETDIAALNAAAVSSKLTQLANGAVYTEDRDVISIHDKKMDVLEELIEEAQEEPVLVFYNFRHDKDRIQAKFGKQVRLLDTEKDIRDWNDRKIRILLAHPASAGHGLNLQAGGNLIVWFGLTWSLELYQQANARLYRQGQNEVVRVYHIIADKTIDEFIMQALDNKAAGQDALMEAVKVRLKQFR